MLESWKTRILVAEKNESYDTLRPKCRVSNRKGLSMQSKFVLVLSNRSTLGKIETTLQIGYALRKVREKAILNHKPNY